MLGTQANGAGFMTVLDGCFGHLPDCRAANSAYLDPRCQWAFAVPVAAPTHSYFGRWMAVPSNTIVLSGSRENRTKATPHFRAGAVRGKGTMLLLPQSAGCSIFHGQ